MKTPAEAEEMFDVISYRKGACIIRMLYDWIGGEVGELNSTMSCILLYFQIRCISLPMQKFRQGLRSYLKTFAYKNAATGIVIQSYLEESAL